MNTRTLNSSANKRDRRFFTQWRNLICAIALAAVTSITFAAAPPANTSIGNQATATYTDASNTQRTATSNTVVTIVQQVASFTLTTDAQRKPAAPGGQVVFPHTLKNTGNGSDTFNLTAATGSGGNFTMTNLALYADANGDGVPDNSTPITSTGLLAADATFNFVVAAIVPGGQSATQTASLTVSAVGTATGTPAPQQNNVDNVTVTSDAVINMTKAVSAGGGPAGSGPYTYTLTYTNTGNNTALNLTVTDVVPAGMVYVPGSARWSITGAGVALTDANDGAQGTAPDTITYDYNQTVSGRVTAVIARVQPGESRTVTFQVNVPTAQTAGPIQNTANYTYDSGAGSVVGPFPTNSTTFTVTQGAGVTITGATVPSAVQGATVSFTNVVSNTGNGPDSFDITLSNVSFPLGTAFQLFKSDGITPMVDTNGNSTPDTGTLPVNGTYSVVVQAILPAGASGSNVNYTVNVTATSKTNATVSANANDVLTTVSASTADLTNTRSVASGATAADGLGIGPEASALLTKTTAGGSQTRFLLFVSNTGGSADSFALAASTVSTFASGLPTGWSIVFTDSTGTVLTNTGSIAAGSSKQINADIGVPAGTVPGPTDIFFRALSPTTAAVDRIHDAINVLPIRNLSIVPNNSGQVVAGGAVVFSHTVTNTGNVIEGDGAGSNVALALSHSLAGWSAVVYFDANGNGVIDSNETSVSNLNFVSNGAAGLAPGESIRLLVKVTAPPGTSAGATDATTLTATTTNGSYTSTVPPVASSTDSAVVVASDLQITKEQALDANLDGSPDTSYSVADITTGALPGRAIRYRVTVRNNGAAPVDNVKVFDSTPAFTTYTSVNPAAVAGGSTPSVTTVPNNGSAGSFQWNVGTLNPGEQAVITFGVKLDQ
ncbi:MAG: beta strand repeat-containing protein [Chthoniobacterales bacterium]